MVQKGYLSFRLVRLIQNYFSACKSAGISDDKAAAEFQRQYELAIKVEKVEATTTTKEKVVAKTLENIKPETKVINSLNNSTLLGVWQFGP